MCRLVGQQGSAALEFTVVALPLLTIFTLGIYLCSTLVTLAQAHREVSFSGTQAMAAVNSSQVPPSQVWQQFFVNHTSNSLKNEAIANAQTQYGFLPSSKFHIAAANYAAGSANRNGQAYGLTTTPEDSKRQVGLKFSPEWYSVLVRVPGLTGFTLHASTMNLSALLPASPGGNTGTAGPHDQANPVAALPSPGGPNKGDHNDDVFDPLNPSDKVKTSWGKPQPVSH